MRGTDRRSIPLLTGEETFFVILALFFGFLAFLNVLDIMLTWKYLALSLYGTLYTWSQLSIFKDLTFEYILLSVMIISIASIMKELKPLSKRKGLMFDLILTGSTFGLVGLLASLITGIIFGWFHRLGFFGGWSLFLIAGYGIGLIVGLIIGSIKGWEEETSS